MDRLRLRAELVAAGCDGFLVVARSSREPAMAAWVGPVHLGPVVLASRADLDEIHLLPLSPLDRGEAQASGLAVLDAVTGGGVQDECRNRWTVAARNALEQAGLTGGTVALAGSLDAGDLLLMARELEGCGISLVPGDLFLARAKRRKSKQDLDEILRVSAVSDRGFREIAASLVEATIRDGELHLDGAPLRIGDLRRRLHMLFASEGLSQPDGSLITPAEEGAVPHNTGKNDRIVRTGESLVVDLFPAGRLFSDCTRTFCVGEPPAFLTRAHATVREALQRATEACKVGVAGFTLQKLACEVFSRAGYATLLDDPEIRSGYLHGLGHGVGWEVHELPHFRDEPGADGVLEEGDIVTLEPGVYDAGLGYGLRLEDLVRVTEGGVEVLTRLPYDLDPRAWMGE